MESKIIKELNSWRHTHFDGKRDGRLSGEYLERESQLELAQHFYNLALEDVREIIKQSLKRIEMSRQMGYWMGAEHELHSVLCSIDNLKILGENEG